MLPHLACWHWQSAPLLTNNLLPTHFTASPSKPGCHMVCKPKLPRFIQCTIPTPKWEYQCYLWLGNKGVKEDLDTFIRKNPHDLLALPFSSCSFPSCPELLRTKLLYFQPNTHILKIFWKKTFSAHIFWSTCEVRIEDFSSTCSRDNYWLFMVS